jgi:uncharacterized damage-inducible protein DinB
MMPNNKNFGEIEDILHGLEKAPGLLASLVRGIPEAMRKKIRIQGKWSIHEHACHIVDVQPMLIRRFHQFKEEEKPVFQPYLPGQTAAVDHLPEMDLEERLSTFAGLRQELIHLVRGFSQEEWEKTGLHEEYEMYTPRILLRHVLMHDFFHMYRIEELWLTRDAYLHPPDSQADIGFNNQKPL